MVWKQIMDSQGNFDRFPENKANCHIRLLICINAYIGRLFSPQNKCNEMKRLNERNILEKTKQFSHSSMPKIDTVC